MLLLNQKKHGKITAVIPIRGGSKRCKNKSIRPFYDTTLLELRINILQQVPEIDFIQVNSDCDEILEIASKLGVMSFKRDAKYATDDADGTAVYECLSNACPTEIMLIAFTPTPFIDANDYKTCIDVFRNDDNIDSVISVEKVRKYLFFNNEAVNFNPLKTCQSQNLDCYYAMTFGITIVMTEFVKRTLSIWTKYPYYYHVDDIKGQDIDTNLDFFVCEQLYKNNFTNMQVLDDAFNKKQTSESCESSKKCESCESSKKCESCESCESCK